VLVVTRLRAPTSAPDALDDAGGADGAESLRTGLNRALAVLAAQPGFLGGEVGRNIDEPELWVLSTRWRNVGSYRRALSSWDAKMHVQPVMVHAVDEPSAYELLEPGDSPNRPVPRALG